MIDDAESVLVTDLVPIGAKRVHKFIDGVKVAHFPVLGARTCHTSPGSVNMNP